MSTCFQKQVGKRKKKDEDTDSDVAAPTTSNSDELMIIEDSNGNGRSERLTKRRKRVDEKDESFEKAVFILENDFSIPVEETMSRKEVIDLAWVLLQSKKDEETSGADPSTSDHGTEESSKNQEERSSVDGPERNRTKGQGQTKSTYKQAKGRQDEFSDEEAIPFHNNSHMTNTFYGKTYSREKKHKQHGTDSRDVVYESEEPLPTNERKVPTEKTERKRQLEEEPKEESQSSQENGLSTRPKKSRNLQLNKKQLETMQAKTSSLLKKTAAKVRLSQENPTSDSQKTSEHYKMADEDEETQAPGSQELFAGETLAQDEAHRGTPSTDGSEEGDKPRTLRSSHKEKIPPEKFMEGAWLPHVPMKRTHYSKAAMHRKSKRNESPNMPFYAPQTKDTVSYSKVIIQLFNIYFRKLNQEQSKVESYMEWGESVKPGRHMSRTVDAKGRGQDSYPWSSESNDDVTIHSDKSSDEENKSREKKSTLRSKTRGRVTRTTRSKKLFRSNSDDSAKGSESDFVSEPRRIQPRRALATPREPIHTHRVKEEEEEDDDASLPDFGISSSDKPPQAGQSCYAGETQPMSPVFQTLVDQTLPMDDVYMADTETLEPDIGEVQSDENDNATEIQPRKNIQRRPSPVARMDEQTDDSDIPMEIQSTKMKRLSPTVVTSSSGRRQKGKESPILPPSQGSSESRGSGSILNSQGEIKSFQKVKPGTFNFNIEDEDSKDVVMEDDDSKDMNIATDLNEKHSSKTIAEDVDRNVSKTLWSSRKGIGKVESSDSDTTDDKDKLDLVHDSPIVASTSKAKSKYIKKKPVKVDVKREEATSEDDFFSVGNSDFDESRKGLSVYSLSSDSADDPKPSTSRKDRVIPIVFTDKYEKRTTAVKYASVKPLTATRRRQSADESDDSADVTEIQQTKPQEKISCPMCSKMFDSDMIERHASDCLGQQEVTSTTGDDDTAVVGTSAEVHGRSGEVPEQDRGDHSVRPKVGRVDGARHKDPLQRRIRPYLEHADREMEQCCVCNMMVTPHLIEEHTNQCIEAKMSMMREAEHLEPDQQDRRSTRSRARDHQGHTNVQPRRVIEVEDVESVSSGMSDDHDPDWTEPSAVSTASATDQDSPMKFKKISQLEEPIMDFKNQFKSKQSAKRGSRRGDSSRGRGKK